MIIAGINIESEYLLNLIGDAVVDPLKREIFSDSIRIELHEDSFRIFWDVWLWMDLKYDDEHKIKISIEAAECGLLSHSGIRFKVNGCRAIIGGVDEYFEPEINRVVLKRRNAEGLLICLDVKRDYLYFAESAEAYIEKVRHVLTIMSDNPCYDKNGEMFDMLMTAKPVKGAHKC